MPSEQSDNDGCRFSKAWIGRCGKRVERDELCAEHLHETWSDGRPRYRCWCGAQATSDCSFAGQFVCGAPLCDDHDCHLQGRTFWHSEKGRDQYDRWRHERGEAMSTQVWEGQD